MLTASSSAWHRFFLPSRELGSCSQALVALVAGTPDAHICPSVARGSRALQGGPGFQMGRMCRGAV